MMIIVASFITCVSPIEFGWAPFVAYSLPLWTIINLSYLLLVFYKKKYRILTFCFLMASLWGLHNTYNVIGKEEKGDLRVMSYNVRLFDVYNWLQRATWDNWEERKDKGLILDSIYGTIKTCNPDVIAFQEFFNQPYGTYRTKKELKSKQGYKYIHDAYSFKEKGSQYGMATFSKYPIIKKQYVPFINGQNNGILISDIVKGTDTIRVLNVHLQSFKFSKLHYEYLRNLRDKNYEAIDVPHTKSLATQLYKGFNKRTEQLQLVQKCISESPYQLVFCGDLNEIPLSYIYEELNDKMKDSFLEAGKGLGITHTSNYPFMRIDYILTSESIETTKFQIIKRELSDHYPIIADLKISQE